MKHGRSVHVAAALVLLPLAACSKGESRTQDSASSAANAAQPVASLRRATSQAASIPGTLTKPLAQYTADELIALAQALTFTGGVERERRCRGAAGCTGAAPARLTRVQIDAVQGVDSLSRRNIPQYGVIAARARNRGGNVEAMYGMRPGNRYTYYLIVLPPADSASDATWQLEQVDVNGTLHSHASLITGRFRGCNHPFVPGARADFKTCEEATVRPASFGNLLPPQGGPGGPIWISCSYGCCTSDPGGSGPG